MMTPAQKLILLLGLVLLISGIGFLSYDKMKKPHTFNEQDQEEARSILREADEYLRQNSPASAREAMVLFNRILSKNYNPQINQLARFGLGVALEKQGEGLNALDHYRKLKAENITEPDLRDRVDFRLGKVLLEIGHEEEGRSLLESILARSQDRNLKSDIHTVYGMHYLRRGERKRSRDNFRVALKYNPDNITAEIGRAESVRSGRPRLSYDYYEEFLFGNARLAPVERKMISKSIENELYEKGIESYKKGRYSDASYYFQKVIESGAEGEILERARYYLAETYLATGKEGQASQNFDRVLENHTSSMDQPALIKKGIMFFQKGKLTEAASYFQKAIDEYPEGPYTHKAKEWKKETDAQIRESSILETYNTEK